MDVHNIAIVMGPACCGNLEQASGDFGAAEQGTVDRKIAVVTMLIEDYHAIFKRDLDCRREDYKDLEEEIEKLREQEDLARNTPSPSSPKMNSAAMPETSNNNAGCNKSNRHSLVPGSPSAPLETRPSPGHKRRLDFNLPKMWTS